MQFGMPLNTLSEHHSDCASQNYPSTITTIRDLTTQRVEQTEKMISTKTIGFISSQLQQTAAPNT